PEDPARLVETDVVGPAVQRREALLAGVAAAAAVGHAVGSGAVPGHADHGGAVVAEVGRPPVLRGGEHLDDVGLQLVEVDLLERLRVVELLAQRVGRGRVLGEDRKSTRLNSSHVKISYAVFCLKKKKEQKMA